MKTEQETVADYASDINLGFGFAVVGDYDDAQGDHLVRASDIGHSEIYFWGDLEDARMIYARLLASTQPAENLEQFWAAVEAEIRDYGCRLMPPP